MLQTKIERKLINFSSGQPGIRSKFATLNVLVPPEPPIISHGEFYLATEDQEFELECSSTGAKPAAEVIIAIQILNIKIIDSITC